MIPPLHRSCQLLSSIRDWGTILRDPSSSLFPKQVSIILLFSSSKIWALVIPLFSLTPPGPFWELSIWRSHVFEGAWCSALSHLSTDFIAMGWASSPAIHVAQDLCSSISQEHVVVYTKKEFMSVWTVWCCSIFPDINVAKLWVRTVLTADCTDLICMKMGFRLYHK